MNRDLELIRKLLFKIETFPLKIKEGFNYDIILNGYSKEEINFNLLLMQQENFILGIFHRSVINKHLEVLYETLEITSKGYKFFASIKSETRWKIIKKEGLEEYWSDTKNNHETDLYNSLKLNSTSVWKFIKKDYGISKNIFGKKLNFIKDKPTRSVVFRDVAESYLLFHDGYLKPAIISSGSVIEEILRQFLLAHSIKPEQYTFEKYIDSCYKYGIIKKGTNQLTESLRHFRNITHISREIKDNIKVSKSIAAGAVASIFTIVNNLNLPKKDI